MSRSFCPHREPLRDYSEAALRSNIDGVTFRAQTLPRIGPLDRHRHARIEPPAAADVLQPGSKTYIPQERHGNLLSTRVRGQRSRWARIRWSMVDSASAQVSKLNNISSLRVFPRLVNGT